MASLTATGSVATTGRVAGASVEVNEAAYHTPACPVEELPCDNFNHPSQDERGLPMELDAAEGLVPHELEMAIPIDMNASVMPATHELGPRKSMDPTNAAVALVGNEQVSESLMDTNSVEPSNPTELSNDGHVVKIGQSQLDSVREVHAYGFAIFFCFTFYLFC